jgi:hypothetical protein
LGGNCFFLPEDDIMKRNFLVAMAGILLALGMMAVGCDTGTDSAALIKSH